MRFWLLALYEALGIIPFAVLAIAPFRLQIRSKRRVVVLVGALYLLSVARRLAAFYWPALSAQLSLLWIALYLTVYCNVVRVTLPKLLFTLFNLINYASMVAIMCSHVGYRIYAQAMREYPYCWQTCLTIITAEVLTIPLLYRWLVLRVGPLLTMQDSEKMWQTLWLVPAIFCAMFYYNLYTAEGVLKYSDDTRSLIFALVIGAGSFFVLALVVRLVETNVMTLRLRAENQQLALHTLQYQRLTDRMAEARHAQHDLRQCMAVLKDFLRSGDAGQLAAYVSQVCAALPEDKPLFYCRQPALNAIIAYYADLSAQKGIAFDAQVAYPDADTMPDTDLVVLFGNLLENAVEACARQGRGERFIRLAVQLSGKAVVVTLDNSCDGLSVQTDQGFLSSKRAGYGVGMESVRQIAQKYGGIAQFQAEDTVFHANILFML